jgi:hypothetical protein
MKRDGTKSFSEIAPTQTSVPLHAPGGERGGSLLVNAASYLNGSSGQYFCRNSRQCFLSSSEVAAVANSSVQAPKPFTITRSLAAGSRWRRGIR